MLMGKSLSCNKVGELNRSVKLFRDNNFEL